MEILTTSIIASLAIIQMAFDIITIQYGTWWLRYIAIGIKESLIFSSQFSVIKIKYCISIGQLIMNYKITKTN